MTVEGAMAWLMGGYVTMASLLIVGWWIHQYKNKKGK